jgi:hypothetical protein
MARTGHPAKFKLEINDYYSSCSSRWREDGRLMPPICRLPVGEMKEQNKALRHLAFGVA